MDTWVRNGMPLFEEQERDVRRDFWTTLKRFAGQVPFVEDLVAAYYCALDPATPMRVRGILLAALAYFIVSMALPTTDLAVAVPRPWLYRRRSRANRPLRSLIAHYSYPSRGSC